MDTSDPGASYPPECAELMERTMKCAEAGDISGCLKLQAKVNNCLRHHGLEGSAIDLPAEYYGLMHKAIAAHRAGDDKLCEELSAQMDEIMYGITGEGEEELWGEETVTPIPPDVIEPLQKYMAALNSGQFDEARRIASELQAMMAARGLDPLPLFPPEQTPDASAATPEEP